MKNKISVVIAQDNQRSIGLCECALYGENFDVLAKCCDYTQALEAVQTFKPDVLLASIVLQNGDGIELLRQTSIISEHTKCVVISNLATDNLMKQAVEYGASYYMVKPIQPEILRERILNITDYIRDSDKRPLKQQAQSQKTDESISRIFMTVGIPPHIKGYSYLRTGIKLAVEDPDIINSVTKKLYPTIALRYETSASKVERAIRHAIEVAWNRGRVDSFNALFGVRAYSANEKPTNSEFIALIADKLLLESVG